MMIVVFVSGRPVLANYLVSLVLTTAVVFHLSVHPFTSNFLNRLEGLSLVTSVITQFASFLCVIRSGAPTLAPTLTCTLLHVLWWRAQA